MAVLRVAKLAPLLCLIVGAAGLQLIGGGKAHAEGLPADLGERPIGFGTILTDADGFTLYTYALDQTPGRSACTGECAQRFPPLLVSADAASAPLPGEAWSHVRRDDGALQWAYEGKPLHRFSQDRVPGNFFGHEQDRLWSWAARPLERPLGVEVLPTLEGHALVDRSGRTLYYSAAESESSIVCVGSCVQIWPPLRAPRAEGRPIEDWTVVHRPDGIRQWAHRGRPLYTFSGDTRPAQLRGHGRDQWLAAVLEPRPANPAWVEVHPSDGNLDVLADEQGRTLYVRNERRVPALARAAERPCDPECPGSDWRPVLKGDAHIAPAADDPHWGLITRPDGVQHWTHNSRPVYVNVRDGRKPGMLSGIRGGDRTWLALTASGEPMQGTGN